MHTTLRNALCALPLLVPAAALAQVPTMIPLQGTLYDEVGEPVTGALDVEVTLYADPAGVTPLWNDTVNVTFADGVFSIYLGERDPIDPLIFADAPQVFVGIAVDGDEEMDLFALATAPYAGRAASAADADTVNGMAATEILAAAASDASARFAPVGHTHAWGELTGVPAGFADGVDNDTVLDEAAVDAMVADNGYLTSVSWGSITGIPLPFLDGVDNVLSAAEVDAIVSDNGYLTSVNWSGISGIPAGFADGVDNDTTLNEAQVDSFVSNNGYLTSVSWGGISGIPAGFADGVDNDTTLSESQVDAFANNNGYATAGRGVEPYNCTRYPTSGYLNNMDGILDARCPSGQVLNGLFSYHSNSQEDRQWAYYCCPLRLQ